MARISVAADGLGTNPAWLWGLGLPSHVVPTSTRDWAAPGLPVEIMMPRRRPPLTEAQAGLGPRINLKYPTSNVVKRTVASMSHSNSNVWRILPEGAADLSRWDPAKRDQLP